MNYNHSIEINGRLLDHLVKAVSNWVIERVTHVVRWEADSGAIKLSLWGPSYRKSQEGVVYVDNAAQQKFWEGVIGKPLHALPVARNGSQQRASDKQNGGYVRAPEEVAIAQPLKIYFSPQPESDGVSKGKPIEMIINKAGKMLWIPSGWDKSNPPVLGTPAPAQPTPPPHTAGTTWESGHSTPPPPSEESQWDDLTDRAPSEPPAAEPAGVVDSDSLADSLGIEGMAKPQVVFILNGLNLHRGWAPDITKQAIAAWKSAYDGEIRVGSSKVVASAAATVQAQAMYDGKL